MHDPATLVSEYSSRGILLDANLLVLYVAGSHDRRLIPTLKATRSGFSVSDFRFVANLVASFDRLVITPHVLTEVNGLLNTGLPGRLRWDVFGTFAERIRAGVEVWHSAESLTADPIFRRLGVTDSGILSAAREGPLVISTDLDLCVALESRGLGVINYNRVRPL